MNGTSLGDMEYVHGSTGGSKVNWFGNSSLQESCQGDSQSGMANEIPSRRGKVLASQSDFCQIKTNLSQPIKFPPDERKSGPGAGPESAAVFHHTTSGVDSLVLNHVTVAGFTNHSLIKSI